jgi:hypothetical protein
MCTIICVGILPAGAQYVEVRTSLDTNQVLIGDQFNLLISITQPQDLIVSYLQYSDTIINNIEILERFPPDTVQAADNQIQISQRYLLTSFDSGIYVIPPVVFHMSAAGWSDSIMSNPLYLAVYTIPLDSAGGIFDIKAPLGSPLQFAELWPYILAALLVGLIAASLFYYLRRRKSKKPFISYSRPEDPPYVIALRELDRLSEEKLWQHGNIKQYYTRLTEIIRSYLEKQFDIPALEMTTDDTLEHWKHSGNSSNELFINLRELLGLADLVKFAKEKPLPSFNEINLERAYDFVRKTRPAMTLVDDQSVPAENSQAVALSENHTDNSDNEPVQVREDKSRL